MVLSRRSKKDGAAAVSAPIAERPVAVHAGDGVTAFRRRATTQVADGDLPAEAFRRKGVETVTIPGRQQAEWIADAIERTLALPLTASIYILDHHLLTALSEHVETSVDLDALARHPDGFAMAFERMASAAASRFAWFAATGQRMATRIETESAILRTKTREEIAARFEGVPPARLDPVPTADVAVRDWIEDMLRGEAVAIGAGLVPPATIARIACRSDLPTVHVRPEGGARVRIAFPAYHPDLLDTERHVTRAAHFTTLSRQIVHARLTALPGFDEAADRTRMQQEWTDLLERALAVEEIRQLSGLASSTGIDEDVALSDVILHPNDRGMGFTAILHVFGDRVCRLTGDGGEAMVADEWSEGCGPGDIEALDNYVAATGEPRDDGQSPDSFAMRVMDIITTHAMVEAYLDAREGHAVFGIEGQQGEAIHFEPIPQGSTREDVIDAYRDMAPRAVSLDDLTDLEAAELWMALSV